MTAKTFLVPLDGSAYAELALPVAESLADRIGGGVVLVSSRYYGQLEAREYLDEHAARIAVPVEAIATNDNTAADAITNALAADDDRIVCMTTHGRGRLRWSVLGSVAEEVIRRADRPMFLVGRNCRPDFLARGSEFLACTDGSDESDVLAPAAREWAEALGLDLRVAMVAHPVDDDPGSSDALLETLAARFDASHRAQTTMVRRRFVAGAIADLAEEAPAAVIGMNCHARAGLTRFALGSVTMAVAQFAPCPLLVTHRSPASLPASDAPERAR